MSAQESKRRRRHRSKFSGWRPLRWGTLLAGILSILMGIFLVFWGARDRNEVPHFFGLIYLAAGGASLLVSGLITAGMMWDERRRARVQTRQDGFALLTALLLVAFLSGIVIQSLIAARLHVRAAEEQRTRLLLRTAAFDAAWTTLRTLAGAPASAMVAQSIENRLPSGIATRVTVRPEERAQLPPPLRRPDAPMFGQYVSIAAQAGLPDRAATLRGLACRLPSGELRIVSWTERP